MQSQVIFKTDKKLKDAVFKKIKRDGLSLKMILNHCMKDYLDGKIKLFLTYEPEFDFEAMKVTPDIQKKMDKIASLLE